MKSGQAWFLCACLLILSYTTVASANAFADHANGGATIAPPGSRPRAVETSHSGDPLLHFVHEFCEGLITDMQGQPNPLKPREASVGGVPMPPGQAAFEIAMNLRSEHFDLEERYAKLCASKVGAGNHEAARRIAKELARRTEYPANLRRAFGFLGDAL